MRKAMHMSAEYEDAKRPADNGERSGEDLDRWNEVTAACAEFSVARTIGRFWTAAIYAKNKTVDILPDIEVRYSQHVNGHLLLYRSDQPERRYVFVTGSIPVFDIHGWMYGNEGMLSKYERDLRPGRPAVYFVPREVLKDIRLLEVW